MKRCNTCPDVKPLDQFDRSARAKDGRKGQCKTCTKAAQKLYRINNRGKIRDALRLWRGNNPEFMAVRRAKAKERGMAKAHRAVAKALKTGMLCKSPCLVCGSVRFLHPYHDNYRKVLDVVWLCATHYSEFHQSA